MVAIVYFPIEKMRYKKCSDLCGQGLSFLQWIMKEAGNRTRTQRKVNFKKIIDLYGTRPYLKEILPALYS